VRGARAYRNLGDGQLGALVAERDSGALDELYVRYGQLAYSLATRIVADADRAARLVEDAFLTLWREAGRLGTRPAWDAWQPVASRLLQLVHTGAVEAIRRDERLRRPGGTAACGFDLHHTTAAGEHPRRVRRALGQLPESQRQTLALAYLGGYTQHEVAVLTGVPPETVSGRMATGLRRLKEAVLDPLEQPSEWTSR
jgi:RNA polymerase sigma factor (sigma-70 family)